MYTITEAAELLELENHTLRYYEDELELEIQRNTIGHRYYREYDIKIFRYIINLKKQGLQLKAIRNALKDCYDPSGENDWEEQGESYLEAVTSLEMTPQGFLDGGSTQEMDITDINNAKVQQFRQMMKETFIQAILENQEELKAELDYHIKYKIEEDMTTEIRRIEAIHEEKDKEHYRRLDETMREMQNIRNETALAAENKKEKKSFFRKIFRKKDKKIKTATIEKPVVE